MTDEDREVLDLLLAAINASADLAAAPVDTWYRDRLAVTVEHDGTLYRLHLQRA